MTDERERTVARYQRLDRRWAGLSANIFYTIFWAVFWAILAAGAVGGCALACISTVVR